MGLTGRSTGLRLMNRSDKKPDVSKKQKQTGYTVAVAGNPNVGKSTLFNTLTGMHQHTGNWPGKTVTQASGVFCYGERTYRLVDIPGTYSLLPHSPEEEVARNYLCFGDADAAMIVCDATCLERNLNLVLQIRETGLPVLVCVNLLDEAKRKGISVDLRRLSLLLDLPVIGVCARKRSAIKTVGNALSALFSGKTSRLSYNIGYPEEVDSAIERIIPSLGEVFPPIPDHRWLAMRLLDPDPSFIEEATVLIGRDPLSVPEIKEATDTANACLLSDGIGHSELTDLCVNAIVKKTEEIARACVKKSKNEYSVRDRRIDRYLTGKKTAYPLMALLLLGIFWLTIVGANVPSSWLSSLFRCAEGWFSDLLLFLRAPQWLRSLLVDGSFRVLGWVVSVMLPPMAIFFPLFTLLEDVGVLPRIAYNLDRPFCRCHTCGKQALTICMGFGCNAAGVIGCRIIDSPRERMLAILTNCFVPCNGRFPALLTLISLLLFTVSGSAFLSAVCLLLIVLLGIALTFAVTWLLSVTLLKGTPSSYTLELPPYRRPQIGSILVRSVLDRTLFVLGRAVAVAAPAGILLWCMANITVGGQSVLSAVSGFLDPFGRIFGMDGVILVSFLLGFPANETVLPIIVMAYSAEGTLQELGNIESVRALLISNGWTPVTTVCTILFMLSHFPCSTTLLTIKKETGSLKWTLLSAVLPTAVGLLLCFICATVCRLFL